MTYGSRYFEQFVDPLGQLKVTAGRDHCFRTCCPYVRTSPLFKSRKRKQQKAMLASGVTMGLTGWIIDDACLELMHLSIFFD